MGKGGQKGYKNGGKGGGKGKMGGKPPQVLEYQFNEMANYLFENLFDWNKPSPALDGGWRDLKACRDSVLQAYGMGAVAAGPAPGSEGVNGMPNWIGEFYRAYNKAQTAAGKGSASKDDVTFQVEEIEGKGARGKAYVATLTCTGFETTYQGSEPSKNKKEAEHWAASAALQAEFPEAYAEASARMSGIAVAPQARGQKRKAAEISEPDAKNKLAQAAQLLMTESMKKGDIVYECAAVEGSPSEFVGTVTLSGYDNTVGYQGLPSTDKKMAETNAATAALEALAEKLAPLEEAHKEKKAAKKAEDLEKWKEIREKKGAEHKAKKEEVAV